MDSYNGVDRFLLETAFGLQLLCTAANDFVNVTYVG